MRISDWSSDVCSSDLNQILMGSELAAFLGVTIGDEIELLHADTQDIHRRTITLNATKALISGLFETGIDECDGALIVTSFNFLNTQIGRASCRERVCQYV